MSVVVYVFAFLAGATISYFLTWAIVADMRDKLKTREGANDILGRLICEKNTVIAETTAALEGAKKLEAASVAVIKSQDKVIAAGDSYIVTLQNQVKFYRKSADDFAVRLASYKESATLQ